MSAAIAGRRPQRTTKERLQEAAPFSNPEAEKSALGAMLIEADAIGQAMRCLHPSHFFYKRHGAIYVALARQYRQSQMKPTGIDLITTATALRLTGDLESVGGAAYLAACIGVCPNAALIGAYAGAIIEAAQYRAMACAAGVLKAATVEQDGMRRDMASMEMLPLPMHTPARLTAAMRKFVDGIDAMGQAKPAPDLKKILEESK